VTSKLRGAPLVVIGIAFLQLCAYLTYRFVERERSARNAPAEFSYETLDRAPRELTGSLERSDGTTTTLAGYAGAPLVVHFWATWCGPCRPELPKLLAWSKESGIPVVLVSVDQDFRPVRHLFDGEPPAPVALDRGGVARAFGVSSLPDTFVLDARGIPTARIHGARDWSNDVVRRGIAELIATAR